jgi:anti-sigma regulatory factor (Ser/Thr protein kinase)
MSETLIPPLGSSDEDPLEAFDLDGFDEGNLDSLNALIADLTESSKDNVGFEDLSIASPYGRFTWRSRPFISSELQPDDTSNLEETRKEVASELRYRYGTEELIDDARIVVNELATNALIHGGAEEEDVAIAGIFRARTIRGGVVFEAANAAASTVDTEAATSRGAHESGNGFEIIKALAEEHGGHVGKYKVVKGLFGRERIVTDPDEITRVEGCWVIWASFQDQQSQTLAA